MNNGDPNLNSQEMSTETSPHWSNTGSANCLPIGTRLAEFEITGVVGEGGFGNVYLAFDHSLQRTVAIKEYMPVALGSRGADNCVLVQTKRHKETFETGMNSFINEARLLAQFDHPALIKVYRFWEQNNTAYMAMRYYEGQTFKSIVNKHPELVTEAWLKPILKPILDALEALYKIQILHRDISPDNIMIQTNGDAVLLDFGAARQIIGDMSQALTVILKPGYAPVEQYAEDSDMKQGPWTDIYALSAVVYSAIVKKPPPTSVTRLIKDTIDLLQNSVRPGFSKEFLIAIDKGMAVKPADRPQSITEFSQLLGIDKPASVQQALPLATSNSLSGQKKIPDEAGKQGDLRERLKSRSAPVPRNSPASKTLGKSVKKASTRGSWALVIAGVVLAAGTGLYRLSHPDGETLVDNRVPAVVAIHPSSPLMNTITSPAASPAQPVVSLTPNDTTSHTTSPPNTVDITQRTEPSEALGQVKTAIAAPHHDSTTLGPVEETVQTAVDHSALAQSSTSPQSELLPTTDAPPKASTIVRLTIKPWATILVDGNTKGVSPPLKRLILPEGHHQIRLVNPNFPDYVVDMTAGTKKAGMIDYDFSSH
jgi:serine/threonine protein kinase